MKIKYEDVRKFIKKPAHFIPGAFFGAAFGAALFTGAVPAITALSIAMKVLAGIASVLAGMFVGFGASYLWNKTYSVCNNIFNYINNKDGRKSKDNSEAVEESTVHANLSSGGAAANR